MKNILLLFAVFFIASCTNYFDYSKFEISADARKNVENLLDDWVKFDKTKIQNIDRQALLTKLYTEINKLTNASNAEIIVKLDLLKLYTNEKQFENCAVSSMYLFLNKIDLNRKEYNELIEDILKRLQKKSYFRTNIHKYLIDSADQKIICYKKLIAALNIPNKYATLKEIQQLILQNSSYNLKYSISNYDYEVNELKILEKKLKILHELSNLIERIPTNYPMKSHVVLRHYGKTIDPITLKYWPNYGIDFKGPIQSEVFATAKGKIINAGPYENLGNTIIIDHENGIKTIYANMEFPFYVKENQYVEIDQPLGRQGPRGKNDSQILHYEIWLKDKPIDPRIFLVASRKCHYIYFKNNLSK